jgi:hypothetical protein
MHAVADEAHMAGLKVAAHAHGAAGIREAIKAGIDTIEHASLVDDEGIKLAVQHGTYFSMDIYNTDYTQAEGKKNGVLEDNLRKDRDIGEIQRQNFSKALKAGVKMIFGTDAGVYPHGDNAKQFATMVRYGATATAGDPGRDHHRRRGAGPFEGCGAGGRGSLRRHDRGGGRSAGRRHDLGEAGVRDEGRRGGAEAVGAEAHLFPCHPGSA